MVLLWPIFNHCDNLDEPHVLLRRSPFPHSFYVCVLSETVRGLLAQLVYVQHTINTSSASALLYCSGTESQLERDWDSHNGSGNCLLHSLLSWWPGDTNVAAPIRDYNDNRMESGAYRLWEGGVRGGRGGSGWRCACVWSICEAGMERPEWSLCTVDDCPHVLLIRDPPLNTIPPACDLPFKELLQSKGLCLNRVGGKGLSQGRRCFSLNIRNLIISSTSWIWVLNGEAVRWVDQQPHQ